MLGFIIFAANAPTVIQQNTDYAFTMTQDEDKQNTQHNMYWIPLYQAKTNNV
jgi:hypothetical protein